MLKKFKRNFQNSMKKLTIILICCFYVVTLYSQKTKSISIEIPETFQPQILLPNPISSIDTIVINTSGYSIGETELPSVFETIERKGVKSDILWNILLDRIKVKSFDLSYDINNSSDNPRYKVDVIYIPDASLMVTYVPGDFSLYRSIENLEEREQFWVGDEAVRKENGKFYLQNENTLYEWINAKSVTKALVTANSISTQYLSENITTYAGIFTVEDKKQDYSAISEAVEVLKSAYNTYIAEGKEEAKEGLIQGAEMLRPFLVQADYQNKKAYINSKVAGAIVGSMAYAFEFAGKYKDAHAILDIINSNKLKLPGGFYYDPLFIDQWKTRINKKVMSIDMQRPELQKVEVAVGEKVVEGESQSVELEITPYSAYSLELLQMFNSNYLEKDKIGSFPEQLLYGQDVEALVSETYKIKYEGIEIYSVGLNEDAISIINFGIRVEQFTPGSLRKVFRIIAPDGNRTVDISAPDGLYFDENGYRRYVTDLTREGTDQLTIKIRKEEINTAASWQESLPEDFPLAEFNRTITTIKYNIASNGEAELISNETKTLKAKIDLNLYLVYQMRKKRSKTRLLQELESSSIPEEIKKIARKKVERIDIDYQSKTYNSKMW